MRYYEIKVGDKTYTSYVGGKNVPGALNVELDLPVFAQATPSGAGAVKIWGIPLADISQASDLNGLSISVSGGFKKGLPLANPSQAGLLVSGYVFQAYGNWIGTDQSLDLVIYPKTGTQDEPKNFSFNWKKGTPLTDAIIETLKNALPDYTPIVFISDKLVFQATEPAFYGTLTEFAQYIKSLSHEIIPSEDYAGVDMAVSGSEITIYDGTFQISEPTNIEFRDMIGQPTWINPFSVQAKFAMRSDLDVGDSLKFPPYALATTGPGSTSPFVNAKSVFQGTFQISQVRHVGNFRQPDAASWVTIVDAFSLGENQ